MSSSRYDNQFTAAQNLKADQLKKVENTLYKLDRGSLCEFSPIFANMFTLPQGDLVTEGLTDENPIHLGDTTAREFDHLIMTCLHVV